MSYADCSVSVTGLHPLRLRVAGELDLCGAPRVQAAAERAFGRGVRHVVVDLSAVSFLDGAGVRCLLEVHELAREARCHLELRPARVSVMRVVEMLRLSEHPVFASSSPAPHRPQPSSPLEAILPHVVAASVADKRLHRATEARRRLDGPGRSARRRTPQHVAG